MAKPRKAANPAYNPLFCVKGDRIFQRPTKHLMGFSLCTVHDGVDPDELCAILNKGEPATE